MVQVNKRELSIQELREALKIAQQLCLEYELLDTLKQAQRLCREALPKFNWAASALDANAITLLNEVPGKIDKAINSYETIKVKR